MSLTINDILTEVTNRNNDTPEETLYNFINAAIKHVNDKLVAVKDPNTVKKLVLTTTTTKPSDFIGFCPPGGYPVEETSTQLIPMQTGTINLKYFYEPAQITAAGDAFPLPDKYLDFVTKHVLINLKAGSDYDVQDEIALLDRDLNAHLATKGG